MTRRTLRLWAWLTALLHGAVFAAAIVAPHDPLTQHRQFPFAPPTRIHLIAGDGGWRRPFIYPLEIASSDGVYREDRTRPIPIRVFQAGPPDPRSGTRRGWRLLAVDEPAVLFLLGTDAYGRDQFSRLLYGARTSLTAGLLATGLALALAVAAGGLAGFAGGPLDRVLMFVADAFIALPWVYLLLAVRSVLPLDLDPSRAFWLITAILALVGWARPARLVRGQVQVASRAEFVTAARALGATRWRVLSRHVLPSATGVLATQAALLVPQFVLAEVTLSFLGLGLADPAPSWGALLSAAQRYDVLRTAWWLLLPVLALVPMCYTYHALADALHHRFDRPGTP